MADEMRKRYGSGPRVGPEVEGLASADAAYSPRTLLLYEDAPEYFDKIVEAELEKICHHNAFTAALYEGRPFGEGFMGSEKRLMLIQALQFVGNDVVNEAVEKHRYLDTFSCLTSSNGQEHDRTAESCICGQLHERFEQHRKERFSACVEQRNALRTAQRILASSSLDAFFGRCAVSCPTRGGSVFECLVALLCAGGIVNGSPAPLLLEKVQAVLTGKLDGVPVIAEGSSWACCPRETARRLQEVVGEEAFAKIELLMNGTWGHVYRESDIPNRHGHCNSNPNEQLVVSFSGFRLATVGG